MNHISATLEDLGYDEIFESARRELGLINYPVARIIAEYKELYKAKDKNGEYLAKITGKQLFEAHMREDYPAVGDWVVLNKLPDNKAVIQKILPRKTTLKKQYSNKHDTQIIATNIDIAFIVESLDRDYNLNRFERFLVLTKEENIKPVIILNKSDLVSSMELNRIIDEVKNRFKDIKFIPTSIITSRGLNELNAYITKGKTYCILGSSGVGKSSLINALLGKDEIKTNEINLDTQRGRHTTTTRQMYFLEKGGIVIDNPGTREVGILDFEEGIENVFDEIISLSKNCKFPNCNHMHEPGCAVLKAVEEEKIDKDRYDNYLKLKKESDFYKMTDLEKKVKDRKFGQFIKKYHDKYEQ